MQNLPNKSDITEDKPKMKLMSQDSNLCSLIRTFWDFAELMEVIKKKIKPNLNIAATNICC